ncbi:hypothetical protein [Streptomyces niveus]|uniref:hypothetical protein n=1 Tax=Streptomyces niveus TaxID=193462 RepID=UPI0003C5F144|nr:hypothetical protein [Streptomyces niveus]EST22784.1 hypothetical protein M877_28825 [Streptomyces niveus NCIMB 11891]
MRVRLTDGTREVEIEGRTTTPLADLEATALRLFAVLDREPADEPQRAPIGFTPDLDGVALSSDTERSDQDARPERFTEWEDDRA